MAQVLTRKKVGRAADDLFKFGLVVKGVDSVFEVVGGFLLTTPNKVARFLAVLSQHELYRHHEVLSGRIDKLSESITLHAHLGSAIYLIVHGLAKLILIGAIMKGRRWGYVGLMVVLTMFTCIEIGRAVVAREVVTGALALFDLLVVLLIRKEYLAKFTESSGTEPSPRN